MPCPREDNLLFGQIVKKLHKNEENWAGACPKFDYVDPLLLVFENPAHEHQSPLTKSGMVPGFLLLLVMGN